MAQLKKGDQIHVKPGRLLSGWSGPATVVKHDEDSNLVQFQKDGTSEDACFCSREDVIAHQKSKSSVQHLKMCPCGEVPKALNIDGSDCKWFSATPTCCDEWAVEFRSNYHKPQSSEAMHLAIEAWNTAPRCF